MKTAALTLLICSVVAGAAVAREDVSPVMPGFAEVLCPAGSGASDPFVYATPGGRVILSWIEPGESGERLRFAAWKDGEWDVPRTVAEGGDWFVNWADVPSVIADDNGRMAAHWLEKTGKETYAYGVRVVQSFDGGLTWSDPVTPHADTTPTEHGFVSMVFLGDYLHVVWLDGRSHADEAVPDETALRAARIDRAGNVTDRIELDGRSCDCCPTAIAAVDGGFVVAYRDRSPDEIRDIYTVRYLNGQWEAPQPVYEDGWHIDGCPVNGPAVASDGTSVVVAWFTMDGGTPVVRAAWSMDRAETFTGPVDIDRTSPIGRVSMTRFFDGSPIVSWMDATDGAAEIRYIPFGRGGEIEKGSRAIVSVDGGRSSGIPRVAILPGGRLLAAWTEPGAPSHIRTVVSQHARKDNDQ